MEIARIKITNLVDVVDDETERNLICLEPPEGEEYIFLDRAQVAQLGGYCQAWLDVDEAEP